MTSPDATASAGLQDIRGDKDRILRRRWSVIATLIAIAVFAEAVFAGAMLSGVDWARGAHAAGATVAIALSLFAGLFAAVSLRGISRGPRLMLMLLSLAVLLVLQAVIGALTAKGANLVWLHVPLGVALFAFARQAITAASRLQLE